MNSKLRKQTTSGFYCGPWAIAYAQGTDYETAEDQVKKCRSKYTKNFNRKVQGMWKWEVETVLGKQFKRYEDFREGCSAYGAEWFDRPTLAKWLKTHKGRFIVNVKGHYIIVDGRKIYDNNGIDCFSGDYPHRRQRVHAYMEF